MMDMVENKKVIIPKETYLQRQIKENMRQSRIRERSMKILAINGSPRKNGHTIELLETTLASARNHGAQTS